MMKNFDNFMNQVLREEDDSLNYYHVRIHFQTEKNGRWGVIGTRIDAYSETESIRKGMEHFLKEYTGVPAIAVKISSELKNW